MLINPYELEKLSQLTKEHIERQARKVHWLGAKKMKKTISDLLKQN